MLKGALFVASAALVAAQSSSQPCAVAASALGRGSSSQGIPAQVAFDCLNSVPVDTSGNQKLIDELKQVWQFQSELIWFKNPGDEWEYGSLDIIGELDRIKSSLGSFRSEYEVQLAIANITVRTGNFHFNYAPDILQVFQFQRPINVASVSEDGKALPKLYIHDDIAALASGSRRVSAIEQINNKDAYEYLKSSWFSQYIDSDGRMNNMFSKGDTDQQGAFAVMDGYDGNSTTIEWANGTSATIRNIATTELSFTGVSDGKSFFSQFCTGLTGASTQSADTKEEKDPGLVSPRRLGRIPTIPLNDYHTRNKRQTINPSTYPRPVTVGTSGVVAGYFLSGQGYEDVAVLKIISFSNPSQSGETSFNNEFQNTVKTFLSECEREKKTKLIIDLRENGGGNTNLLLDAFMQLFPSLDPFSGQRYRASDAWLKIGEAVDEIRGSTDLSRKYRSVMGESMENTNIYRYWAYWHFRKADGTNFADWDEFNGPLLLNSDNLTTTMRYNYSSADRISISPSGFNFVNGTRPSLFDSKNVIMFTDALCGSSCASFHEELKNVAGVRAVTVGGRPENKPIQTVTGSKGGEVIPMFTFPQYASNLLNISSEIGLSIRSSDKTLSTIANVPRIAVRAGDGSSRVQSQDQIRKGDKTATPLQFIYEAADCRMFYTPESYADPDAAWKQAWDAFVDKSKCVEGSTGHKSSISGGFKPFGAAGLTANDQPDPAPSSGDKKSAGMKMGSSSALVALMISVLVATVV